METNKEVIESLFEEVVEYGKTNLELFKLKVLDKVSDVVSSLIPHSVIFFLITTCLFFLNLGLAILFGEILGVLYLGFFLVGGFYLFTGLILRLFFYKSLKRVVSDFIIKHVLK